MGTQRHSWWQKIRSGLRWLWQQIKKHSYTTGIVVLLVLILFIFLAYRVGWDWTGFSGGESKITITSTSKGITTVKELQTGRTLWDWLQLLAALAVPVVVGFGAAWFTRTQQLRDQEHEKLQREHDQEAARIQHDRDQQLADQRAESERKAAEQQAELERELTRDNQRETLLQAYIDKMSELLLDKDNPLRESKPGDEIREVARVRTLTVLPRLDKERKRSVLQFLYESRLIDAGLVDGDWRAVKSFGDDGRWSSSVKGGKGAYVIALTGADVSGANLSGVKPGDAHWSVGNETTPDVIRCELHPHEVMVGDRRTQYTVVWTSDGGTITYGGTNLLGASLAGANLSQADLSNVSLTRADLSEADLSGANLSRSILACADLDETNLSGANLSRSILTQASLSGANLSGANLSFANLSRADLSEANLSQADLSNVALTRADLSEADLSGANLSKADLTEANLSEAEVTQEQLEKAKSLKGATMPDGSKHP